MLLRLYERPVEGLEERVLEILRKLDMLEYIDSPMGTLSRGQVYKCALSGLILLDPELWMLDEPFAGGMDPLGIAFFKQEARKAAERGRTIMYSTQIVDVVESFSDLVCVLHKGGLEFMDSLAKVKQTEDGKGKLETIFAQLKDGEE